jgi:hypothetical protein
MLLVPLTVLLALGLFASLTPGRAHAMLPAGGGGGKARAAAPENKRVFCTTPTFAVFPGSTLGRIRYGEVDFHFEVCSSVAPNSWYKAVTRQTTNGTGQNLGFFIDSASIVTTRTGGSFAWMRGTIAAHSCLPRVGWPCYGTVTLYASFYAYIAQHRPHVVLRAIGTSDPTIVLYRTP